MVKKSEILSEKNTSFRRVYFIEGFIDIFFGSADPNTGEEVSSPIAFYRLEGEGEWVSRNEFFDLEKEMNNLQESAKNVWKKSLVCTKKV